MEYKLTKDLQEVIKLIDTSKPLMFDTETMKVDYQNNRVKYYGKIRLAQFYQDHWDMPVLVEYPNPMELTLVLNKTTVVCHNASYDISTIQAGLGNIFWCPKKIEDTFYLARLKFSTKQEFNLAACAEYCTGDDQYADINKADMQKSDWDAIVLTKDQLTYAAMDVYILQMVWDKVKEFCPSNSYKLDMHSLKYCLSFQCNGMPVDRDRLEALYAKNLEEIEEIDLPINANSYKQVRPYIGSQKSDDLGLAIASLEGNIRAEHVRRTRKLLKLNSFLDKFVTNDGKIYGKFSPSARSGRCTSKDQNLQQLPRATKGCFGVDEDSGLCMVYSDFSQLELRCAQVLTRDPLMLELYEKGYDLHSYTQDKLLGTKDNKAHRTIAKTCNFGLLYGASAETLRAILIKDFGIIISSDEATHLRKKWMKLWTYIEAWQERGFAAYLKRKAWSTPLGRKYVGNMSTDQLNIQVQGMGAEVSKLALHYMYKKLSKLAEQDGDFKDYEDWQVNFIHDSYIWVLPKQGKLYKELSDVIATSMRDAWHDIARLSKEDNTLGMPVEVVVGYNWGELEDGKNILYKKELK